MGTRIALVDDDQNILTSVSLTLESEGFEVDCYHDGETALRGLSRRPAELAVLDIKMPRMDGMELLQKIRTGSNLPVIFLTSKDDELDEDDCDMLPSTHPLYVVYTSGTTGPPVGIVRDHGSTAVALNYAMKNIFNVTRESV